MAKGYVAVLCEDLYEEIEVWYPYYRLKEEGYDVLMVGTAKEEYKGKYGYPARADKLADQVNPEEVACLVIPGGYAPDILRRYPSVVELVKKVYQQGGVVASICHGPWLLASADVVRGKKVTCFMAIKDDIVNAGGLYEDREVVRDGNLITSRKPADLPAFLKTIIEALKDS